MLCINWWRAWNPVCYCIFRTCMLHGPGCVMFMFIHWKHTRKTNIQKTKKQKNWCILNQIETAYDSRIIYYRFVLTFFPVKCVGIPKQFKNSQWVLKCWLLSVGIFCLLDHNILNIVCVRVCVWVWGGKTITSLF